MPAVSTSPSFAGRMPAGERDAGLTLIPVLVGVELPVLTVLGALPPDWVGPKRGLAGDMPPEKKDFHSSAVRCRLEP